MRHCYMLAGVLCFLAVCSCAIAQNAAVIVIKPGTADIQSAIDRAIAAKASEVRFEAGTHRISNTLRIRQAKDMTLSGAGATLVMTKFDSAFSFERCENVSCKGIAVDYDPLPFTQGIITSVGADNQSIEFRLHDGYPSLNSDFQSAHMHLFDRKTRLWKRDTLDFYPQKIVETGERTGRAEFSYVQNGLAVGDLVAFDIRSKAAAVMFRQCGDMLLEDVRIFSAPGLTIAGRYGTGQQTFRKVTIGRGPRPDGASEERLLSSSADGVNYAYNRKGPILDQCDFSFQGDDSLNVHGAALPMLRIESSTSVLLARPYGPESLEKVIRQGDEVRLLSAGNFAVQGRSFVKSFTPLEFAGDVTLQEVAQAFPSVKKISKYTIYRMELSAPISGKAGDWLDIPAINSPDYVVRNSYFHDHRARGLRIMGNHGLIEGNRFERISNSAISIGPEFGYWREAGWVQDITIRNNTIRDVGTGMGISMPNALVPGAIGVYVHIDSENTPIPHDNQQIIIEKNTIDGCTVAGIHAYSCSVLTIDGNILLNIHTRSTGTGTSNTVLKAIDTTDSPHVEIRNNKVP